jgi:hypothetical protein
MQVTIHNNAFPEDQEFEIPGLGLVKNHEPKELDANQVATYKAYGLEWPDDNNLVIDQNEPEKPKEPIKAKGSKPKTDEDTAPISPVNLDNDEGDK